MPSEEMASEETTSEATDAIWQTEVTLDGLNAMTQGNMTGHLGIEYTEVGPDFLCATMPVDERTQQPFGILHGGASVVLAETLGSVASNCCVPEGKAAVGLAINANHVRSARAGRVTGRVRPVHIGRSTHVWQIEITDEEGRLVCQSRLTMAVIEQ